MLKYISLIFLWISMLGSSAWAESGLRIGDICRLKGQEENSLHGIGLVVGLKGTGDDGSEPTTRGLSRMVQLLGGNISSTTQGLPEIRELADTKNVALVMVTAKIPPAGAQQGDQLNCTVSAVSAKSIQGGNLMLAYMRGPRADDPKIYGIAQGAISTGLTSPTTGIVHGGCKMEATVINGFTFDDKITLILDKDLASFSTTIDIADTINALNQSGLSAGQSGSDALVIATAVDQLHVEVEIPRGYRDSPVKFVSLVEELTLANIRKPKRVVLNEKDGVIIIGEDVLINPVAIAHKNLSIDAKGGQAGFVGFDTENPSQQRPTLKNLVDALNALKVPTEDVIAIIRSLDRNGDLYGEVVFY